MRMRTPTERKVDRRAGIIAGSLRGIKRTAEQEEEFSKLRMRYRNPKPTAPKTRTITQK